MDDPIYLRRRAEQSLDQAARAVEPMRSIHMEMARAYSESWRLACEDQAIVPPTMVR